MFTVYHSNKLDTLKILLVNLIRIDPLSNPFDAEQILVQSPGMSQWLKMALAEEFGVAANLAFPLPATFIWEVFTRLLPDVPKQSAFNKGAMTWKLLALLPEVCDQPEFYPIKHYLDRDDSELNRYQLAEKIADVFDGYLVYRPDWIEQWESGQGWESVAESHRWQPMLWHKLYQYTLSLGQSHYHRANLYQALLERLQDTTQPITGLPQRLFIFGITALPPRYMEALQALGAHIDIHLMLTNPCQYYWGDIRDRNYLLNMENRKRTQWALAQQGVMQTGEQAGVLKGSVDDNLQDDALHIKAAVGNNLLASLGKQGRDNLQLLTQMDSEEHAIFVEVPRDSLLHQLQADILNLEEHDDDQILGTSTHKQTVRPGDHSLTLHACHSATREVEVLHDHLLYLLDQHEDLHPRDVIVMVADIDDYSAAIQAVFGSAPGERFIPYSISDRTADKESPLLGTFLHLLNLPHSRCLASELLELLELPAMLQRFGVSDEQFIQAKRWIEESGIRWGLNGVAVAEFGVPANNQNTWEFGIERMLTGYAMVDSAGLFVAADEPIAPYNEVQGLNAELAGKLASFIDRIRHYRRVLGQAHTIEHWQQLIAALLDDFFALNLDEEVIIQTVREAVAGIREQLTAIQVDESSVDADVLRYCLHQKLATSRVSQRFLAGQVNFCTLMPMRSIPFKVVCLLGMNDGAYPRNTPAEGFDLMTYDYRPGDRSRRDDDRYLFLEALLSAQTHLYISYIGQSNRDNTVLTPSVLVTELMEYCQQNYCLSGDETLDSDASGERLVQSLLTRHPMMPYSASAFTVMPGSYASEWLPVVNRLPPAPLQTDVVADYWARQDFPYELDLMELQRFWRLPVRYFFNRRLNVALEMNDLILQDEEPFTLNGLQSYQLTEDLLNRLLSVPDGDTPQISDWMASQQAQGKLPMGAFGQLEFEQHLARAQQLAEPIRLLCQVPLEDIEVTQTLMPVAGQPIHLVGWLRNRYQSGRVQYRPGRIRAQDYLSAWIHHLAMAVTAPGYPTHLIGIDRQSGVSHLVLPPLPDVAAATVQLTELVAWFYQGMNQPLAYFPATALAAIESATTKSGWQWDDDKALKAMTGAFNGNYFSAGDGADSYIQRVWPEWSASLATMVQEQALKILSPARRAVMTIDEYRDSLQK